jgi:hypothetical protein
VCNQKLKRRVRIHVAKYCSSVLRELSQPFFQVVENFPIAQLETNPFWCLSSDRTALNVRQTASYSLCFRPATDRVFYHGPHYERVEGIINNHSGNYQTVLP